MTYEPIFTFEDEFAMVVAIAGIAWCAQSATIALPDMIDRIKQIAPDAHAQ